MYKCEAPLLWGPNVEFSLNITGSGGWGSSCHMRGCAEYDGGNRYIPSVNICEIPGEYWNICCMTYNNIAANWQICGKLLNSNLPILFHVEELSSPNLISTNTF